MYIEVRTTEFPFGIIRGQIRKLERCTLDDGTFSVIGNYTVSLYNSYISRLVQYYEDQQTNSSSCNLPCFVFLFMVLLVQLF